MAFRVIAWCMATNMDREYLCNTVIQPLIKVGINSKKVLNTIFVLKNESIFFKKFQWKIRVEMNKEFTWNYFLQLQNGFAALCILVMYHSEYAVIFITNWSPPHISWQMTSLYSFKHNTKNMRTKKEEEGRWDQLSSENWPFHKWTLSADNKEKVKYERGSHLKELYSKVSSW